MRVAYFPWQRYQPIRPTGNWSPALAKDVVDFFSPLPPLPFPDMISCWLQRRRPLVCLFELVSLERQEHLRLLPLLVHLSLSKAYKYITLRYRETLSLHKIELRQRFFSRLFVSPLDFLAHELEIGTALQKLVQLHIHNPVHFCKFVVLYGWSGELTFQWIYYSSTMIRAI